MALWLISMGGEWLADYQLTLFRRNPIHRGKYAEEASGVVPDIPIISLNGSNGLLMHSFQLEHPAVGSHSSDPLLSIFS